MAYAFGFPRDVTKLVDSLWDWRYRLVRGGGKTPSASAMPLPVPPRAGREPITTNMEHGKFYIQRMEFGSDDSKSTMINIWQAWGGDGNLIRSFECCNSDRL